MKSSPTKPNNAVPKEQKTRPPVVVVMGHIDHGKSTLLDYIRKSNIVASEKGGITQHMSAYQAEHTTSEGKTSLITFIDTPGHSAFLKIRERGAKAADIAILVVSAEDGVKPQTLDALKAIRDQKIPFVVAINKIDKPNADIDRAKQSLGENEVYVEGWGGDVPCVPISALRGDGVSELLDMVMLVAEMTELSYDSKATASGIVIESKLDPKKGISATLLIKNGTLTTGSYIVAGDSYAPVRFIENFLGKKITDATASMPVNIVCWSKVPEAGSGFVVVESKKQAEVMVEESTNTKRQSINKMAGADNTISTDETAGPIILPIIIKADTHGSLDGIKHELAKIKSEKVRISIVSDGIGDINESDIKTVQGDPSIIVIGFNTKPDGKAQAVIERSAKPIDLHTFGVIYELTEFITNTIAERTPKEYIEEITGRAKILALFSKDKDRQVAGGKVESGTVCSGNDIKLVRRDTEIGRGKIRELQEKKVRTNEVAEGHEFGMMIESKFELAVGDRIECVRMIEKNS